MIQKSSVWKIISFTIVLSLLLVSCAKTATPAVVVTTEAPAATEAAATSAPTIAPTHEPVTIEWMQWFQDSSEAGAIDGLIAEFEKEYPYITVNAVAVPFGEMRNQIVTNSAAGTLADVIGMNPPWMAEFVGLNVLEPLDEYLSSSTDLNASELVQGPMAKYQGKTWQLPVTVSTFVLFYNKTLFTQAGLEGAPKNWAEFRDYAKKLTQADNNIYGFNFFMNEQPPMNGSIITLYPLIFAAGGRTLKEDGSSNINSPEVIASLQLLKDLSDDGSVYPGTTSKTEPQMVQEFASGNVGMMIENTGQIGQVVKLNPDLDFGIVAIPSVNGDKTPDLRSHGWELGMSANSEHKAEAWLFMQWLVSKGPNSVLAKASNNIPGNMNSDTSFFADSIGMIEAIEIIKDQTMVEELMKMPKATQSWSALTTEIIKMLTTGQSAEATATNTDQAWASIK